MPRPAFFTVQRHKKFFHRTIDCFREGDASFQPRPDMLSVQGQIMHVVCAIELYISCVAVSVERFKDREWTSRREGGRWLSFGPGLKSMEWVKFSNKNTLRPQALARTVRAFNETMDIAADVFGELTEEEMVRRLPKNPNRLHTLEQVFEGMLDHTAHHRGALAQYARLLSREPSIPYFDMAESLHEASLFVPSAAAAGAPAGT